MMVALSPLVVCPVADDLIFAMCIMFCKDDCCSAM